MKYVIRSLMVMSLAFMAVFAHAQNLLEEHNGNFQTSNASWLSDAAISTQYEYTTDYGGLSVGGVEHGSGKCIVSAQSHNANSSYFYCSGHSGLNNDKFLVVNGYGGNKTYYEQWNNTPSNKKVIQYTLQVQPSMLYDFYFWATHLTNGDNTGLGLGYFNARVQFRVQCNGTDLLGNGQTNWEPEHVAGQPKWCKSPIYRCCSNSSGQLVITIYDDCVWTSEYGDDFGIDDVSLTLASGYSVVAHQFEAYGCQNDFPPATVLDHVDITQPAGQPNLPATIYIRKNSSSEWTSPGNVIQTNHGSAYIGADQLLHYTPEAGFLGLDQLQYRVLKYGIQTAEKPIYIHVMGAPSDIVYHNFPEDHWCQGDPLQFSATCNNHDAPLLDSLWQYKVSTGQNWTTLNLVTFQNNASCGDYHVRYVAENVCGTVYGDAMLLRVCNEPVLSKTSITVPSTICEGGSLPDSYLSQVTVSDWKNDVGVQGWQVKHGNGSWTPIGESVLSQGDKLRYYAENCCGFAVTNEVSISVTAGPEFLQPTPLLGDNYCVGETLELSSQTPPIYQSNGIAISEEYWVRSSDGGNTYTRIYGNPTLDLGWDGNRVCYRLVCPCGTVNSSDPFVVHVYGDPVFAESLEPFENAFCAGDVLTSSDLQAPSCSGSPDMTAVWQISNGSSPSGYGTLSLPRTLSRDDHGKWIRRSAASSCGNSSSNAIQIQVNDKPSLNITAIAAPDAICSGGSLPPSFTSQVYVADWNGDQTDEEGWWIKHPGGDWEPWTPQMMLQNGDVMQYRAANVCGTVSSDMATLVVTDGPALEATPPFEDYCIGDVLSFPEAPGYSSNGLTVLPGSSYWAYADEEGMAYTPINAAPTLTEEWNGRLICYCLAYQCGNEIVYAYSSNPVSLTVYGEPALVAPDPYPVSLDSVCWGTSLMDVLPEGFEPTGAHYDHYGWEISEGNDPNSAYDPVDDPENYPLPVTDNGHWLRFVVEGCGTPAVSQPMKINVGDAPSLYPTEITNQPLEVCEGTSVGSLIDGGMLTDVSVDDWHLFDDQEDPVDPSYERWEVYYNGQWRPLSNFELAYNGCLIRYVAHNRCGTTVVGSQNPVAVVEGPMFTASNDTLQFNNLYCVNDLLVFPPIPDYVDPYDNITDAYWASSYDGLYYSKIGEDEPVLTENWHGRYVTYVLESNCGGLVTYATPFQLYVVGNPEVLSASVYPSVLCEGETLERVELDVDWHNGSDHGSSWQYASESDPDQFNDFDPYADVLPAGNNYVRYHAENGCYQPDESDLIPVRVNALPYFLDDAPIEMPDVCVGTSLVLPEAPAFEGDVESDGYWQISETTAQQGAYVNVTDTPLTMDDDGKWLKYSVVGCDGKPVSKYGVIHVAGLPQVDFDIPDNLCRGQLLNPVVVPGSVLDVDYVLWKYVDGQGHEVMFNPMADVFEVLGTFDVSWAPVNHCNDGNPEFCAPKRIEVVQGPEFKPVGWPDPLVVCAEQTLSEVMDANHIAEPGMVDPQYQPVPQPLGWFLKSQDEENNVTYLPVGLSYVITEQDQGNELCYGMLGDCSTAPIYSNSTVLRVKGRPVIGSVEMTSGFCSGEIFPAEDLEVWIDDHGSGYTAQWQWLKDQKWEEIPGQSFMIGNEHDGVQVRYCVTSTDCVFAPDMSSPITLRVTGVPEILEDIQETVGVCADGALAIVEPNVNWHNTLPQEGVWQVCSTPNGVFGTGPFGSNGLVFDMEHVAMDFDGWYLRYHVEGCQDENNSNMSRITVLESSTVQITGVSQAAVMNSYWPGVYYYYTDVTGGGLNWSLTPEIWPYQDTVINGKSCCKVIVNQKGQATLTASVGDGSCGTDSFVINASPFGVDETEDLNIALYPNPNRQTVNVVAEAIVSVTVYDMLGQRLKTVDGHRDDHVSISVDDLPEALYLVEVQTEKGNKTILLSVL